jgi:hypothetical protein
MIMKIMVAIIAVPWLLIGIGLTWLWHLVF